MERWDLLDYSGRPTGKRLTRGEPVPPGQYHRVVHIWIVNAVGCVLIQKRAPTLLLMPNVWAVTGGSVIAGEDSLTAARRELHEELGLETTAGELHFGGTLRRRNSICDIWVLRREVAVDTLTLQKEEVAAAQWVSWEHLLDMAHSRRFHNYGTSYFEHVREALIAASGDAAVHGEGTNAST